MKNLQNNVKNEYSQLKTEKKQSITQEDHQKKSKQQNINLNKN